MCSIQPRERKTRQALSYLTANEVCAACWQQTRYKHIFAPIQPISSRWWFSANTMDKNGDPLYIVGKYDNATKWFVSGWLQKCQFSSWFSILASGLQNWV
jgi:hypothetical protein